MRHMLPSLEYAQSIQQAGEDPAATMGDVLPTGTYTTIADFETRGCTDRTTTADQTTPRPAADSAPTDPAPHTSDADPLPSTGDGAGLAALGLALAASRRSRSPSPAPSTLPSVGDRGASSIVQPLRAGWLARMVVVANERNAP